MTDSQCKEVHSDISKQDAMRCIIQGGYAVSYPDLPGLYCLRETIEAAQKT